MARGRAGLGDTGGTGRPPRHGDSSGLGGDAAEFVTSQTTSCCQSRAFPGAAPQGRETQLRQQQATCDLWVPPGKDFCCSGRAESLPKLRAGTGEPPGFPGDPATAGGSPGTGRAPHLAPSSSSVGPCGGKQTQSPEKSHDSRAVPTRGVTPAPPGGPGAPRAGRAAAPRTGAPFQGCKRTGQ